jgi:hypothetical protein
MPDAHKGNNTFRIYRMIQWDPISWLFGVHMLHTGRWAYAVVQGTAGICSFVFFYQYSVHKSTFDDTCCYDVDSVSEAMYAQGGSCQDPRSKISLSGNGADGCASTPTAITALLILAIVSLLVCIGMHAVSHSVYLLYMRDTVFDQMCFAMVNNNHKAIAHYIDGLQLYPVVCVMGGMHEYMARLLWRFLMRVILLLVAISSTFTAALYSIFNRNFGCYFEWLQVAGYSPFYNAGLCTDPSSAVALSGAPDHEWMITIILWLVALLSTLGFVMLVIVSATGIPYKGGWIIEPFREAFIRASMEYIQCEHDEYVRTRSLRRLNAVMFQYEFLKRGE